MQLYISCLKIQYFITQREQEYCLINLANIIMLLHCYIILYLIFYLYVKLYWMQPCTLYRYILYNSSLLVHSYNVAHKSTTELRTVQHTCNAI